MKVTRQSTFSGITRTKDLPITSQQWDDYCNGALIQDAMPNLNINQREFIITGMTPAEWRTMGDELEQASIED